jgi:hypothetical protein
MPCHMTLVRFGCPLPYKKHKTKLNNPVRITKTIPPQLQQILWNQPHASSSDHIPGRLDLCIGMPVML